MACGTVSSDGIFEEVCIFLSVHRRRDKCTLNITFGRRDDCFLWQERITVERHCVRNLKLTNSMYNLLKKKKKKQCTRITIIN